LSPLALVGAIACTIFLAGVYSGGETGIYTASRVRLRLRGSKGDARAALLADLMADQGALRAMVSMTVLGHNLAVYVGVSMLTAYLARSRGEAAELYSTLLMTPLVFVFSEVLPKSLFRRKAEEMLCEVASFIRASYIVFWAPAKMLDLLGHAVAFFVRGAPEESSDFYGRGRLEAVFREGASDGVLSPDQHAMAARVLRLRDRRLAAVMVPLDKAVMVEKCASVEEFRRMASGRRLNRLPVYDQVQSRVVGVAGVMDILRSPEARTVGEIMRPIPRLRADICVSEALGALRNLRFKLGAVADGAGRVVGIVTMRDFVEEIVGEISAGR